MASTLDRDESVLLPDPPRAERFYTLISPDDHLVEPPHLFEGRLPATFDDHAPKVIRLDDGTESWSFDGTLLANIGLNATVGRRMENADDQYDPVTFDGMRRGTYDIHERIRDMDIDGVYASMCFPSFLTGFGGVRLQTTSKDLELSLALVRAWNDWHLEEWAGSYPNRIIPNQIAWLHDPVVAAEEIRRNAARGFHAVTFPESPTVAGFPSLHSGYWDPFMAACAETGTVISIHTGSSGALTIDTVEDAPRDTIDALFGAGYALQTTIDWLYSRYAARFPDLKIVVSEGGIGWVVALMDRLDHSNRMRAGLRDTWAGYTDLTPRELLQRNFWWCCVDEPSSIVNIDRIGLDHVMFETDYPHTDTSWPNSQQLARDLFDGHREELIRKVTWQNAATLFQHPVPEAVQRNPNAF